MVIIGGLLGAILGFLAAVPVARVILFVYTDFCKALGGKDCEAAPFWTLFIYAPVIAFFTTTIGIIIGVIISNNYQTRRPPPPSQPSELELPNRYD